MLPFIEQAVEAAAEPEYSVVQTLRQVMAGREIARGYDEIHASDMTKEDFCARRIALLDKLKRKPKAMYVPSALRATYDMGKAIAALVCEQWAGDKAWGHWRCDRCQTFAQFCPKPPLHYCAGGAHIWRYVEVKFKSPVGGYVGSLDLLMNLGAPKLYVVELKIMAPEQFQKIIGPLAEHRLRTNLYLRMIEDSGSLSHRINLHQAVVMYVSRGYGKKNEEHADTVLPFKEYWIKRDDTDLKTLIERAQAIDLFRKNGAMPYGVCPTPTCKIAKYCSVRTECFNGHHPPGH